MLYYLPMDFVIRKHHRSFCRKINYRKIKSLKPWNESIWNIFPFKKISRFSSFLQLFITILWTKLLWPSKANHITNHLLTKYSYPVSIYKLIIQYGIYTHQLLTSENLLLKNIHCQLYNDRFHYEYIKKNTIRISSTDIFSMKYI